MSTTCDNGIRILIEKIVLVDYERSKISSKWDGGASGDLLKEVVGDEVTNLASR